MAKEIQYPPNVIRTFRRYAKLVRTFRNWPVFLLAQWQQSSQTILLRTRQGWSFEVPPSLRWTCKEIFLYECYGFAGIVSGLPEIPWIIDVGANAGFFSVYAFHQRRQARLHSFEPQSANFSLLLANHTRARQPNWFIHQEAVVGGPLRSVTLRVPSDEPFPTGASIVLDGMKATSTAATEIVKARNLPEILSEEGIPHCDWLKLDCEGAEYAILYSLPASVLKRISMISVETHLGDGPTADNAALADFLERHSFRVWQARDSVLHARRLCPDSQAILGRSFSRAMR
jgi:FkbM family methyltransferase